MTQIGRRKAPLLTYFATVGKLDRFKTIFRWEELVAQQQRSKKRRGHALTADHRLVVAATSKAC